MKLVHTSSLPLTEQSPMRFALFAIGTILLVATPASPDEPQPPAAQRRVDVHLFGGDLTPGAPLASWYHSIGITDVWLYPLRGAFPQDQHPDSQQTAEQLGRDGTLNNYRTNAVRYWWFERPVPDYFYATTKRADAPQANLWDSSRDTDQLWADVCRRIREIYPTARRAGFTGFVFDNESYYSYQGDESGRNKPWVWGGHDSQYGTSGNYYRRGLQVGQAIHDVWPDAKVIMVYAHGYPGERWWYQGVKDGGTQLLLGPEHTYGAGPGDFGTAYYQVWWNGQRTKQTCDWKQTQFPFITSNRQILAGLFPIDFGARKPNYRARYFREQLLSAATEDTAPIGVWLWPQGPFTPQSWLSVQYADGDTAETYLQALRQFSSAFADPKAR